VVSGQHDRMSATAREHDSGHGDLGLSAGVESLASAHAQARQRADGGDLTGARTMLEDALVTGELRLGRDHPRLVPLMLDLSTIAQNVGNLTEAQNQLRRAYAIAVAANGPEHASSVSIEGRLATVCDRLGEPTDAYDWHITEVGPRVLGADHAAVRGAQKRLAVAPPPPPPPAPLEPNSGGWAPASYEDDELGYASTYTPAPRTPGVYQRRSIEAPETDGDGDEYAEDWERPGLAVYPVRSGRGNTAGIVVVASLGLAVIVAAAVVAVQIFGSTPVGPSPALSEPATASTAEPVPTGKPPASVTLVDNAGSVTLAWSDPSDGKVPFIVAGGRTGTTSVPLETVPPGRTTSTIYGLNDRYDYCFTVAAVWSSEQIETSMRTCTRRLSTGAAPSVPITASTA
jgi:hypothetical protein